MFIGINVSLTKGFIRTMKGNEQWNKQQQHQLKVKEIIEISNFELKNILLNFFLPIFSFYFLRNLFYSSFTLLSRFKLSANIDFKMSLLHNIVYYVTGRRQCMGEALARMEVFIFMTTLVQNLHFEAPPGKKIDISSFSKIPFVNFPHIDQDLLVTVRDWK